MFFDGAIRERGWCSRRYSIITQMMNFLMMGSSNWFVQYFTNRGGAWL